MAVSVSCQAQVYSVGVYAAGVYYEHDWVVGRPQNCYGLSQYGLWVDQDGLLIIAVGRERENGAVHYRRYTRIHFGAHSLAVRAPAWLVALIGVVSVPLLILLAVAVTRRVMATFEPETHAA
jgi:hypothetical protein